MSQSMYLVNDMTDYEKLGIDPVGVKPFEDGLRTDGSSGTWEWWYFDAHLDNGAKLVVVFYTKPNTMPHLPLSPFIRIALELPDGRSVQKTKLFPADTFTSAKETCDVKIADNHFKGDLHRYHIQAQIDELSVDVTLTGQIRAWRPKSGHMYCGDKLFAWLPSVPQGEVSANIKLGDEQFVAQGTGYHDHNWGNAPMKSLIHHWYWGRAKVGDFTVIASHITAAEAFDYTPQTLFMLAKNGQIVADDEQAVRFSIDEIHIDEATQKPVADIVKYEVVNDEHRYVITFHREKTIMASKFIDQATPEQRAKMLEAGDDGAYLRFVGKVSIAHFVNGNQVAYAEDEALWELMYFGKALLP